MIEILVNLILAILAMIGSYQAPTVSPEATVVTQDQPADAVPVMGEAPTVTCREDEECWDCETMGNFICGHEASMGEDGDTVTMIGEAAKPEDE